MVTHANSRIDSNNGSSVCAIAVSGGATASYHVAGHIEHLQEEQVNPPLGDPPIAFKGNVYTALTFLERRVLAQVYRSAWYYAGFPVQLNFQGGPAFDKSRKFKLLADRVSVFRGKNTATESE